MFLSMKSKEHFISQSVQKELVLNNKLVTICTEEVSITRNSFNLKFLELFLNVT